MSIHDKIIQLRKVVPENGATEAEALAALQLAAKLMEKHGITEEELNKTEFERDMSRVEVDKDKKSRDPAIELCGKAIEEFCEVKLWWGNKFTGKRRTSSWANVFGFHRDVEMAVFLIELISKSMKRSWNDYLKAGEYDKKISKHQLYWSFRHGFADRINSKLKEMKDARNPKGEITGTDLVVLKGALVEEGRNKMFPNLILNKNRASTNMVHLNVYADGMREGDKVNLNRPIRDKENIKLIK